MKKWLVLVAGSVVTVSSLGLQAPATATSITPTLVAAHPSGCFYGPDAENGARATCKHSNGGHYKASVTCDRWDNRGKVVRDAVVWKSSGYSVAYCPPETSYLHAGIITKAA